METGAEKSPARGVGRSSEQLRQEIEAQKFYQFLFSRQWFALKAYCNDKGIKLVGDIPIFVAHDSADVWTNPNQFKLNEDGSPIVVYSSSRITLAPLANSWGNPLYNWDQMRADGFKWWISGSTLPCRPWTSFASITFGASRRVGKFQVETKPPSAGGGGGPGRELFISIREALGELPIIAEDLGVITPDVEALRDDFGFPGMRILQFAFSSDAKNHDLPHNYHSNVVVYTGTHDNDTTVGWFQAWRAKALPVQQNRSRQSEAFVYGT